MINLQRLLSSLPYIFAMIVLAFLAWALSQAIVSPYDGFIGFNSTGVINEIDPDGPSATNFFVGDRIISIDDVFWEDAQPPFGDKRAGNATTIEVMRDGETRFVSLTLVEPPLEEMLFRLAPLLVGLVFWIIGASVQAFKQKIEVGNVTFAFFMMGAVVLIAGAATAYGSTWTSAAFGIALWLMGPVAVHFHTRFPQPTDLSHQSKVLILLYVLAVLGSLPYIVFGIPMLRASIWYSQFIIIGNIFLSLNFLLVVSLLFYSYHTATTAGARGKIRIVVLGGMVSLIPLVTLVLLPDALLGQTILPYGLTFVFLAILPLTYGYAIYRHRLIEIERHVNRGATFILVYSILGAIYLVLYSILHTSLIGNFESEAVINTFLVLVLATAFVPIHRQVQRFVDRVFYGGWYDYRSAIMRITQGLEQITDLNLLAKSISNSLVNVMHLQDACVFLKDHDGNMTVIDVAPASSLSENSNLESIPLPRSSLDYLFRIGEIERASLREAFSDIGLTAEEHQLLNTEQDHLWIPIVGHGEVQGLLALGPKYGGDIFSSEDLDILRVVARQLSPIIENAHLLTQLRQYATELEHRVEERTAELHEAKERVEAVLASVGDGVIVTDLDGTILTLNAAYEEQSGYSVMELVGENLHTLLREHNDGQLIDDLQKALPEGVVWRGELVNQHKNGNYYDIQLTIAPVRDQKGQMVYYVGSQRDITQQKELDRMKDRFVSDVSHELRTPTTNISLYLELLENAPPQKRDEYLAVLRDQGYQLRKLVEDILDLSRLSMGRKSKAGFGPVNMDLLVSQVVTAHKPMAEAEGIRLELKSNGALPPVRGEENQLARVITNLVSNALCYTKEGEVCVRTYPNEKAICLEVCDTGIGIDPQDLPHIFERFYRGKHVRQSRTPGTGLGLAIVKEIIDQHDGRIDIESNQGAGSTFRIWLPIYEEE
jgi:PAS domain S-box-containing protein